MKILGMMALVLVLLLVPTGRAAADGWVGGMSVARLNVGSGQSSFGTTSQPSDTCSYFGFYFRFDATTTDGKNMYATLLAAKLSGKTVAIWYTPSPSRGTNETNGCAPGAIATVYQVALE